MTFSLEYHVSVRHSIPASLALFSLCALPVILVSTGYAQVNGAPASVTSPGFGGRPVNGTPPSVTSLVCESGGEDFFCYFRVSDYDFVVEGVWENFDDWVAGILCAAGVPDFAGGDCVHVGSVCDFLA